MHIFTDKFLKLQNSLIVDEVRNKGFFKFEGALTDDFINDVANDVKTAGISLNTNNVSGVYFTH